MNTAEEKIMVGADERNVSEKDMNYRALSTRGPSTLDVESRSLEAVMTTETPVLMWDWERAEYVKEVLLAKGMSMPKQVPLLDTHSRYSVSDVLGSVRNKIVEEENKLVSATVFFSKTPKADETFMKYEEGHLTDFSVGYRVNAKTYVDKGEVAEIGGRTFKGPVNVATSWTTKELSCCPIGADPQAKVRADFNETKPNNSGDSEMDENEKKMLESIAEGQKSTNEALANLATALGPVAELAKQEKKVGDEELSVKEQRDKVARDRLEGKKKAELAERTRITEIEKMCDRFEIDDETVSKFIVDGTDVNKARELVMERVAARSTSEGTRIIMGADDRTKLRGAMVDGIMLRAGIGADKIEDHNNEFRALTLTEMARRCLQMNNQAIPSTKSEIFKRALSTSDFDNILADAANKALNDGFEKADETYSLWVDTTGVLNDYKGHQFSRASEAPSLQSKNPDGGEYEYGKMTDTKETVTAADYGIIVPFTKKAMVNDDLGALDDIRMKLGEAAARKWGDLVYAVLSTGTTATMGDGVAVFHASHSNYVTAGGAPSVTTLNAGFTAMATQKDLQGIQNLNIRPEYIIGPWALKGSVDNTLVQTNPVAVGTLAAPVINPFPLTPVYDSRLDTFNSSGWFLAARKGKTVKLFTLDGQIVPNLASKIDWTTDSIDFKADIAGAAAPMDYRGLYYNDGVN